MSSGATIKTNGSTCSTAQHLCHALLYAGFEHGIVQSVHDAGARSAMAQAHALAQYARVTASEAVTLTSDFCNLSRNRLAWKIWEIRCLVKALSRNVL